MAVSKTLGLVATLAELEDFYKGQPAGNIIELMNQTNDILDDVPWMESNQSDGHLTRIRTGLPEVYWRRLYQGTPPSKSQWSQVKEGCGILEALMELDVEETKLYADKLNAFRMSESKAFTEAMRQKVAKTLFYGDSNVTPDEFNGLSMRYPGKTSPHVVDAGGTGAKCTSMWLVSWGAQTVHGLYPKGSQGGFEHKDMGEYVTNDDNGRKFEVLGDKYSWSSGRTVLNKRSVDRMAKIVTTKLGLSYGESGFVDLQKLTIMAKDMMPGMMRSKAIWYCNQDVMTALEMQAIDPKGVHLTYGEFFDSKGVPILHGRPVRQCDAIISTESALV